jgi:hypothetical protein
VYDFFHHMDMNWALFDETERKMEIDKTVSVMWLVTYAYHLGLYDMILEKNKKKSSLLVSKFKISFVF